MAPLTARGPEQPEDEGGFELPGEPLDGDGDDGLEPDDVAAGDAAGDDRAADDEGHGQVAYELDGWAGSTRQLLDGMLENADIPRAWEGGTLVVDAEHEAEVDALVDEADGTAGPRLDPEEPKVAYEVGDWDDGDLDRLVDLLVAAEVAYDWDDHGDLLVLAADEDRAEEVFDRFDAGEEADADGDGDGGADGPEAAQVLSDLFVASDRLMHDAEDHQGVLGVVEAAGAAEQLSLPFGFEAEVWAEIVARAAGLRRAIEEDVEDDAEIVERATELRTRLREFV